MAALMPTLKFRPLDANGAVMPGAKLYSFAAQSDTPLATYTDEGAGSENQNPVVLDANGEADVWLSTSSYKFRLDDADDVPVYTVDNVTVDGSAVVGASLELTHLLTTWEDEGAPVPTLVIDGSTAEADVNGLSAIVFKGGTNGNAAYLGTEDTATGDSSPMFMGAGASADANGGIAYMSGGNGATRGGAAFIEGGAATSGDNNGGHVYIISGQRSGSGSDGDILVNPNVNGKIKLQDSSLGTAGHVWTSTDTGGSGAWAAPAYSNITFEGSADRTVKTPDGTSAATKTINIQSGDMGVGAGTNSGNLNLKTGATSIAAKWTGNVVLASGAADSGGSGSTTVSTGDCSGSGTSGNLTLKTGTSAGTRGHITLDTLYAILPTGTTDPAGVEGACYYNTSSHVMKIYNGSAWKTVTMT